MGKALEPESLSLAADNYYDALQDARRALGKTWSMRRSDVGDDEPIPEFA